MKLRYLVPSPNVTGGIQHFALSVRSELLKIGYKIEVDDYHFKSTKINSVIFDLTPTPFKNISSKLFIAPEIININKLNTALPFHCWHIDACLHIPESQPFLLTVHGLEILKGSLEQTWFRRNLSLNALTRAKAISADSVYTKSLIFKSFPDIDDSKIKIIYPPIDVSKYIPRNTRKKTDIFRIGTLCRLVKRKNVYGIIQALNKLHAKNIDFEYYLAGDGELKDELLLELERSHFKWKYLGKLSDKEKTERFFPSLDLFVMPTLSTTTDVEGFGIVYLEASASGVPVLGSRVGGAAEAILEKSTGLFVDPQNIDEMASTMYKMLTSLKFDPTKMRAWAKKFDTKYIAQQFDEMYQESFLI